MEGLKSLNQIYSPKTIYEVFSCMAKSQNARLFAGGTNIMTTLPGYAATDLIVLDNVYELSRASHTETYTDLGSMLSLTQMLTVGASSFSGELYKAIESIGSSFIRNQATIGGALCTKNIRLFLSCILSGIGAQIEIRTLAKSPIRRKPIPSNPKWIPVSNMYKPDGTLDIGENVLLTAVRIPTQMPGFQVFQTLGNVMKNPSSSVCFTLCGNINQSSISNARLCISFGNNGFFTSADFDTLLNTIQFPVTYKRADEVSEALIKNIKEICPNVNELQLERTKRLFKTKLFESNSLFWME